MTRIRLTTLGVIATAVCALFSSSIYGEIQLDNVSAASDFVGAQAGDAINGQHIVLLKPNSSLTVDDIGSMIQDASRIFGLSDITHLLRKYDFGTFKGFAAQLDDVLVDLLRNHQDVLQVEQDQHVRILDDVEEPSNSDDNPSDNQTDSTQGDAVDASPPSWGLARISHRLQPYESNYPYSTKAGEGIDVYVIDSGIYLGHSDFEGRASLGINLIASSGSPNTDCHGHGTHVAGTIAGKKYGVAKKANLVAVKVLACDGGGSMSDVISAVQWVTKTHIAKKKKISVINMSIGGGVSSALNQALAAASNANILIAAAAGNSNADACNSSPSNSPYVVSVGATDSDDKMSSYSNFGSCVDILAPGSGIVSCGIDGPNSSATKSGTSMATPHVAGTLALFAVDAPSLATADLYKWILNKMATVNAITNLSPNTPNLLVYTSPPQK